ncbi:hypothetical protein ACFFRL_15455 [Agromyces hippuratus]
MDPAGRTALRSAAFDDDATTVAELVAAGCFPDAERTGRNDRQP